MRSYWVGLICLGAIFGGLSSMLLPSPYKFIFIAPLVLGALWGFLAPRVLRRFL